MSLGGLLGEVVKTAERDRRRLLRIVHTPDRLTIVD